MKTKQKVFVLNQLLKKGQVSRNTCLSHFISRLGAIMNLFKESGLKFEAEYFKGDYVYKIKGQKRLLKDLVNYYQ
jgi:hypothetical protein